MEASDHRRGPDTASMCRDEETPDYNAWHGEREREAWNIFLRVSTGTIMSILRRAIGSYNRAHIWLRKGVEPWGDTRRDPACHRDAHPDFYRLEGSRYRSVFGRVPPF